MSKITNPDQTPKTVVNENVDSSSVTEKNAAKVEDKTENVAGDVKDSTRTQAIVRVPRPGTGTGTSTGTSTDSSKTVKK